MADITMCSGEGCDMKLECYRYTANRDKYQYYFVNPPIENGKCEMFWDNNLKRDKKENGK